ncbi:hypothetical protein Q5752_004773 [Cryptotrichosporon argae]
MPPRHGTSSSKSSPALPPRLTVPPFPPRIHRRLVLSSTPGGVVLRSKGASVGVSPKRGSESTALIVKWGVKGKVEVYTGAAKGDDGVELGGILGIVRLWDAAYLLVFLPSTKAASPMFPNHLDPFKPDEAADRAATASSHEVHTLSDVYPVPLVPDLATKAIKHLLSIQTKRQPKRAIPRTPSKTKLNLKFSLPWAQTPTASTIAETRELVHSDFDTDSDTDGTESESDDEAVPTKSRESLAPEADETPAEVPPPASTPDRAKKRFSAMGWGKFMPKLPRRDSKRQDLTAAGAPEATGSVDPEVAPPVEPERAPAEPDDVTEPVSRSTTDALVPEVTDLSTAPDAPFANNAPQRRELETKILRQMTREFSSGGFFYSFDCDLTHTLQHKRRLVASRSAMGVILDNLLASPDPAKPFFPPSPERPTSPLAPAFSSDTGPSAGAGTGAGPHRDEDDFVEPDVHVPLWRRVDRRFFWNEYLMREFIELGQHAFVLPISQGWCQSASFSVPVPPNPLTPGVSLGAVPVDLVVISRRSKDRAGLRYQRRGIDDEGHVANMVETEMIVRAKVENKTNLFSFVQVRGSIPLKWSQSPYSMKPPPVLDQPIEQTYSVANLHFDDLTSRYGPVTIVNLSEQTGKEAVVTNGYKTLVDSLGRADIVYKDFDFHAKCHGMKWENISELVGQLDFGDMGYLWTLQGDMIRDQRGAFRTNCIDCLDRTNVVQSALARHVLGNMLTQLGLIIDPATSTVENVFNDIWANNGDMISFCYAHTSALKGDFVRTGKRDLGGMIHDGVSSISRMFYGAVSDFFAQAVISFLLGHRNLGVFSEFLETLQSTDASALIKLSRVRAAAIETSSARVLSDGEQRVAGWTLLSPEQRSTKISSKMEEKVLLLTKVALYVVSFNYSLEKVIGFTRIPLASITSLQKGAYILSPLQEASRDPSENAGFMVHFSPANESTRYSTYSIRNKSPASPVRVKAQGARVAGSPTSAASGSPSVPLTPGTPTPHVEHAPVSAAQEYFAFKVLPREFAGRGAGGLRGQDDDDEDLDLDAGAAAGESCSETVGRIVRRLAEAVDKAGGGEDGDLVVEADVVSLVEAERETGILARMDYAFKRFLWL